MVIITMLSQVLREYYLNAVVTHCPHKSKLLPHYIRITFQVKRISLVLPQSGRI